MAKMPTSIEKRRHRLNRRQPEAKIVRNSVRETLQIEDPVLVRDLAVNRINVMIEIYSDESAEPRITQKEMER